MASFNAYADRQNELNADDIAAGKCEPIEHSSEGFIFKASCIERRHVMDKEGVLDPERMYPRLRKRDDGEPGIMGRNGD